MLCSLFFRNKAAYVIGRVINAHREIPFAVPMLQNERGELYLDALLIGEDQLLVLFSFARAYFFVDMEVPAAYVSFLRWLMPRKPRAELYMAVGLAKQGKTLFYRDLHYHLKHSTDRFMRRARHQGHGDAGLHAAVVSVRVQADPRPLRAAQGDRPPDGASTST